MRVSTASRLAARWPHAGGNLVPVVAPQVLLGAPADELLERAVESAHRRLGRTRLEKRLDREAVSAARGKALRVAHQHRSAGLLREAPDERHGVRGPPEKLAPLPF